MRLRISWLGSGLLLLTLIHGFGFNDWLALRLPPWPWMADRPLVFAVLCHAVLVQLFAAAGLLKRARDTNGTTGKEDAWFVGWIEPLAKSGGVTAALAIPFIILPWSGDLGVQAAHFAMVTAAWLAASFALGSPRLLTAAEVMASVAIAFATAAIAQRRDWAPNPLTDLRHIQLQLIVLGFWSMLLGAVRQGLGRTRLLPLVRPDNMSLDRVLPFVLAGILFGLALVGCWPGVQVELGYRGPAAAQAPLAWHSQAYQAGSWFALAVIAVALAVTLLRGPWSPALAAMAIAGAAAPMLISGPFESQRAVVSALRWTFAAYAMVMSFGWCGRSPIARALHGMGVPLKGRGAAIREVFGSWALGFSYLPVIVLTSWVVIRVAAGAGLGGPAPDTFFARLSLAVSYALPLVVLVIAMLSVAIRDRSSGMAFASSTTFVYVIALSVLLPVLAAGEPMTIAVTVSLVQWCSIGLGAFALLWFGLAARIEADNSTEGSPWLRIHLAAMTALTLLLPFWSATDFLLTPTGHRDVHLALGSWPSYLAVVLAFLALAWYQRRRTKSFVPPLAIPPVLSLCVLAASTVQGLASPPGWLGYHCLTAGLLVVGLLVAALACWGTWSGRMANSMPQLTRWAASLAIAAFVLTVRGCVTDPWNPWWTMGAAGAVGVLCGLLGVRGRRQGYAYATWAVATFAVTFLWADIWTGRFLQSATDLVLLNLVAAAIVGIAWLALEVWFQLQRNESLDRDFRLPPVHATIAVASSLGLLLLAVFGTGLSTVVRFAGSTPGFDVSHAWGFVALGAVGALLWGTLWDRRAERALATIYIWGIAGIATLLNLFERLGQLGPQGTVIGACLLGAAYIALTGHLWKWGLNLAQIGMKLGMPQPLARLERTSRWLPTVTVLGSLGICLLGFGTVLTADLRWMRMAAAFAPTHAGARNCLSISRTSPHGHAVLRVDSGECCRSVHRMGGYSAGRRRLQRAGSSGEVVTGPRGRNFPLRSSRGTLAGRFE